MGKPYHYDKAWLNHWQPVGMGDHWIAKCLGTDEFVAVGNAASKPIAFPTAALANLACENAASGIYDNAPPGDVWRVISDGVSIRRGPQMRAIIGTPAAQKVTESVPTLLSISDWARAIMDLPDNSKTGY